MMMIIIMMTVMGILMVISQVMAKLLLRGISLGFAFAARGGVDTVAMAVPSLERMFAHCAQGWV